MSRKKVTSSSVAGRPPKDPEKKIGTPARALLTTTIAGVLQDAALNHDIPLPLQGKIASDIVRLYLYWGLQRDGLLTNGFQDDPSWDTLKERGLV